ncbi:MAG: SAF domain-containing protein [Acidimicrobiia bacterium]
MLWLQPIPWARWAAATAIAAVALWVEIGGGPSSPHPFALVDIGRGEALTSLNTELREVPTGLLEQPGPDGVAARPIPAGAPILPGDTTTADRIIPADWWVVATEIPPGAMRGDPVQIVLLEGGGTVQGVAATTGSEDPFQMGQGAVAVPPEAAESVARAAATGSLVVLVGTG